MAEKLIRVIYTDGCIYNHGTVVTWSLYDEVSMKHFRCKIWYFKANKKHELQLQIVLYMWQTIGPVKLWILVLIFSKKILFFRENPAVVICLLLDDVTTKHFRGKILYFKWNRYLQQGLNIFANMKSATWEVERLVLALKYWREIRHGHKNAIRTYDHGRLYVQKNCTFRQINTWK